MTRAAVNIFDTQTRDGELRLGATVYDIEPGMQTAAYHYHHGDDEWLLVLAGRPTLRTPDGERELRAGDLVAFPEGPDGAHAVANRSAEPARVVLFSTKRGPAVAVYPDTGELAVWRIGADDVFVSRDA